MPHKNPQTEQGGGKALRIWRAGEGASQGDVAERVGVHRQVISLLESGEFLRAIRGIEELTGVLASSWVVVDHPLTKDAADGGEAHAS